MTTVRRAAMKRARSFMVVVGSGVEEDVLLSAVGCSEFASERRV